MVTHSHAFPHSRHGAAVAGFGHVGCEQSLIFTMVRFEVGPPIPLRRGADEADPNPIANRDCPCVENVTAGSHICSL